MTGALFLKNIGKYITKIDTAKVYIVSGQLIFISVGYLAQILLSKIILSPELFAEYQFMNFLTNILNFFVAASIPILLSREIARLSDEKARHEELYISSIIMLFLTSIEFLIILIMAFYLFISKAYNLEIILVIVLSMVQVFFYGLMNLTNMFLIGARKLKDFFKVYAGYIFLKSILIILSAMYFKDIKLVLIFLILAELIQTIINLFVIKPKFSTKGHKISLLKNNNYINNLLDIIVSNLVVFGLINFAVVISYLGLKGSFSEFNIFTLVNPWTLISYYIISSIGNIYLVDFAKDNTGKLSVFNILKKIGLVSLLLSILSSIGGMIFFFLFYREDFRSAVIFLIISIPLGSIISLISILVSIYQGKGEIKNIRWIVIFMVIIFIFIISLSRNLELIALEITLVYSITLIILMFKIKKEDNAKNISISK